MLVRYRRNAYVVPRIQMVKATHGPDTCTLNDAALVRMVLWRYIQRQDSSSIPRSIVCIDIPCGLRYTFIPLQLSL